MVVLAADVVIVPVPSKRDSVLVIHLDGVAACLVALQGVQVVAWRNLEVVEPRDQVELFQFPLGGLPRGVRDTPRGLAVDVGKQIARCLIPEGPNHGVQNTRYPCIVPRLGRDRASCAPPLRGPLGVAFRRSAFAIFLDRFFHDIAARLEPSPRPLLNRRRRHWRPRITRLCARARCASRSLTSSALERSRNVHVRKDS